VFKRWSKSEFACDGNLITVNRRTFISTTLSTVAAFSQSPQQQRHALLISIDGFAAYSLRDPKLPVPNIRNLARNGVVADGMQVVNPAVTWPNHTSMVTGVYPAKHRVLYNGLPVRTGDTWKIEAWVDKRELVQVTTLYDVAHAAGMTTAEVDWVAIHNAKTITWTFPERPRLTDPVVKEMIAAGHLTELGVEEFSKAPITYRDEIWTLAGQHIIETHKPNLLLWHLLTTDSSQHRYGARSLAGDAALALADSKVGRLIESLRTAGILDRTTIVITSDHGFKTYKRQIQLNALFKQQGLKSWCISEGGTAMIYAHGEPEEKLRTLMSGITGVGKVLGPADFDKLGYPQPSQTERMANLVVAASDGYSFSGGSQGETVVDVAAGSNPGAHGYLNADAEMNGVFVASGAGIKPAAKLGQMRTVDIAPTLARLLGVQLSNLDGRVLGEILQA
jgi:predicted AlkP superfamily pyrophosphatase or phosphodiesterase